MKKITIFAIVFCFLHVKKDKHSNDYMLVGLFFSPSAILCL